MRWPTEIPLTEVQRDQLAELERLALAFNEKLNLYSRSSAEEFRERHIAHSLALASRPFPEGSVVVDWGTGGGMPGLVLAIAFPSISFHLVDSVGKKIRAVRAMARRLELANVEAHHTRAEAWEGRITHSVSRATAPLETLWTWHERVCSPIDAEEGAWQPGLLCLKGGALDDEVEALQHRKHDLSVQIMALPGWLRRAGLDEKVIVQVTERYSLTPRKRDTTEL